MPAATMEKRKRSREQRPTVEPAAAAPKIPAAIADFSVLPISIPPSRAYPVAHVHHHIYVRPNAPRNPTPDDERSLFLANVPADSTEAHLRAVFVSLVGAGKFEGVTFEDERNSDDPLSQRKGGTAAITTHVPAQAARLARTAHASSKKRKRDDDEEQQEGTAAATAHLLFETWPRRLYRSGSTAVVLLADEKCVALVLKAIAKLHKPGGSSKHQVPVWGEGVGTTTTTSRKGDLDNDDNNLHPLGIPWLRAHNTTLSFPPSSAVQSAVDAFFVLFNKREKEAAEAAKRMLSEPDEDGFVTVTRAAVRGSRAQPARMDEAEEARRRMVEKEERRKRELGGFYRFQHREQKKAAQAELARRFEEDRKKVASMREKRGRFKPEA